MNVINNTTPGNSTTVHQTWDMTNQESNRSSLIAIEDVMKCLARYQRWCQAIKSSC